MTSLERPPTHMTASSKDLSLKESIVVELPPLKDVPRKLVTPVARTLQPIEAPKPYYVSSFSK